MNEIISCILFPSVDIEQFHDPNGEIWIQNVTTLVTVSLCNLSSIIEEAKLEDYSFWLGTNVLTLDNTRKTLKYLKDHNIKYSSFTDYKERVMTNPNLVLLEEQLQAEEHRIRFTHDETNFIIYDNDNIIFDAKWRKLSRKFVAHFIDEILMLTIQSSIVGAHRNIDIYQSDIPLFIRWLRNKYTIKAKSANKI